MFKFIQIDPSNSQTTARLMNQHDDSHIYIEKETSAKIARAHVHYPSHVHLRTPKKRECQNAHTNLRPSFFRSYPRIQVNTSKNEYDRNLPSKTEKLRPRQELLRNHTKSHVMPSQNEQAATSASKRKRKVHSEKIALEDAKIVAGSQPVGKFSAAVGEE